MEGDLFVLSGKHLQGTLSEEKMLQSDVYSYMRRQRSGRIHVLLTRVVTS